MWLITWDAGKRFVVEESMTSEARGADRETTLDRGAYFSDKYFSLPQMGSFSHQINAIHARKPKNILEIGIGNGFTSTLLRHAGYDVVTADINPNLEPDICAPLAEISEHLKDRRFDLVVCCEVLEHMPLEELEANIGYLRQAGDRLFLTLPNYRRSFGIGGLLKLPGRIAFPFRCHIELPLKKKLHESAHFWEVGSQRECTRRAIVDLLRRSYTQVSSGTFALNPYHIYFNAE
jgi:SAM-dependent methyltransferase